MMDLEQGMMKGAREGEDTAISGCYFHFKQSLVWKLKQEIIVVQKMSFNCMKKPLLGKLALRKLL